MNPIEVNDELEKVKRDTADWWYLWCYSVGYEVRQRGRLKASGSSNPVFPKTTPTYQKVAEMGWYDGWYDYDWDRDKHD